MGDNSRGDIAFTREVLCFLTHADFMNRKSLAWEMRARGVADHHREIYVADLEFNLKEPMAAKDV